MSSEVVNTDVNSLLADPAPSMGDPPDTVVNLLLGIPSAEGQQKKALVREMTGEDEEYMASLGERSTLSYPEYLSALLKRVVISIGDIDISKFPEAIDALIVGDRDLLFLGAVKATYGKTRTYTLSCPSCASEYDLTVDMDDDFPIEGEELLNKEVKVTLKDGMEVHLNFPTSGDSAYVNKRAKTVAEQNTLMIARCAQAPVADKEKWAKNLGVSDRKAIMSALLDLKVGPKVEEVKDSCANCGEDISVVLDWVSLLFG